MINSSSPQNPPLQDFLKIAWGHVKANFRQWMMFTQIVSLATMGAFLIQDIVMRLTGGSGILIAAMLLWPLYATLYGASFGLMQGKFTLSDMFTGFTSLWRTLGLTMIHNLVSFVAFFPFYMIMAAYIFDHLGWSPEQFQSLSAYKPEHIEALTNSLQEVWPMLLAIALPAWPIQIYIQSRIFMAYYYVVQKREPVFQSIGKALKASSTGQLRRLNLVIIAEFLFPILIPLFIVTYPLKYAIYALLVQEIEGGSLPESKSSLTVGAGSIRNPYLE